MIFIDSNVPMYLVGAAHQNKNAARRLLGQIIRDEHRLTTSAEVLQEILHRYVAIARPEAIEPAFAALLGLVDEVFDVRAIDVMRAKELVLDSSGISARDALHIAVMEREGVGTILSFDRGFDRWPGIERLGD